MIVINLAYAKEVILKMKDLILKAIDFNVVTCSSNRIFEIISRLSEMDERNSMLALLLTEMSIIISCAWIYFG